MAPAAVHLRLLLDPLAPVPPTATDLGLQLADRLRSSSPVETLWPRLVAALTAGPQGGWPWLLLIENVDAQAQAEAGRTGQPLARLSDPGDGPVQKLGSAGWTRVPVAPMTALDARNLLLSKPATKAATRSPLTRRTTSRSARAAATRLAHCGQPSEPGPHAQGQLCELRETGASAARRTG